MVHQEGQHLRRSPGELVAWGLLRRAVSGSPSPPTRLRVLRHLLRTWIHSCYMDVLAGHKDSR
ncbi:hypothetical protein FXN61_35555 [Lentzea sp. PSKA42]|uniref:Uncharacterized protein n=1 Tax=Lentzea indica TaxID=2604800 RepID=A0ABX1FRZ4_9PSEU|nr:hypothetical protein [Lentzea indica]